MLKLAQNKLGEGDFSQVSNLFGESATELLGAAPAEEAGGVLPEQRNRGDVLRHPRLSRPGGPRGGVGADQTGQGAAAERRKERH